VAKGSSGSGEWDTHIVSVRARITGSGFMRYTLEDYSAIRVTNLAPLTMASATNREPTVLTNFQSQRTRLIGQVTDINEWFEISRVIIFAKPVAIEFPQ
jgi:hypothetical protein